MMSENLGQVFLTQRAGTKQSAGCLGQGRATRVCPVFISPPQACCAS